MKKALFHNHLNMILGTNLPAFQMLLSGMYVDGPCIRIAQCRMCRVLSGEALSKSAPCQEDMKGGAAPAPTLQMNSPQGFPFGADTDSQACFQPSDCNWGLAVQPNVALSFPYFAIIKDSLYWVIQDTQRKEQRTQMFVPKSRQKMLFQETHHNLMAGHFGQDKTLNCLMACFYWPVTDVHRWCAACAHNVVNQLVNLPATRSVIVPPSINQNLLKKKQTSLGNWNVLHEYINLGSWKISRPRHHVCHYSYQNLPSLDGWPSRAV